MTRHWNWFNADALGLLRGHYSSVLGALRIGERAIRKSLRDQLGMLKADAHDILGDYPTLIGEIGVPFDMDAKRSYGLNGNSKYVGAYTDQTRALDCSLNGADGNNVINWTLWTYAPDKETPPMLSSNSRTRTPETLPCEPTPVQTGSPGWNL